MKIRLNSPLSYALIYFLLIPIFALIYLSLGIKHLHASNGLDLNNYLTCLYFSTVTITTLGYGDISATTILSQTTVIFESIVGLFIIGLFLNALSQVQAAKITANEKRKNELIRNRQMRDKLLRFNRLVVLAINDYKVYTYALTTPIDKRNSNDWKPDPEFHFRDMADLFQLSLLSNDLTEPVIALYLKKQSLLIQEVRLLLTNIDFDLWPDLESICLDFLQRCKEFNSVEVLATLADNIEVANSMKKMIADTETDNPEYYPIANIFNYVIMLYKLVKANLAFVNQYETLLEKIASEPVITIKTEL